MREICLPVEGREGEGGPPFLTSICAPEAMLSSCTNRAFRHKRCQRTSPCHHLKARGWKVPGVAEALSFSLGAQPRLLCGSQPAFCSRWMDGPSSGGCEWLWGARASKSHFVAGKSWCRGAWALFGRSLCQVLYPPRWTPGAHILTLSLLSAGEMPFPMPGSTSSRSKWTKRSSRGPWRDRLSEAHNLFWTL